MKRKLAYGCVAISLILLAACSNDGMIDSDKTHSDTSIVDLDNGIDMEKITLSALSANKQQEINKVMNFTSDNLILNTKFDFDVPDEIGKYKIMCVDNFQDNWDILVNKYIPANIYDESKVINDERYYPYGPEFRDEESGMNLSVGCTGFFYYSEKTSDLIYRTRYEDNYIYKTTSCYLNSDYTDDVYVLNGGETSISEAVSTATEFVSDFTQISDYPQKLEPTVAVAYQDKNGSNVICTRFGYIYKGLPICIMPDSYESLVDSLSFNMLGIPATVTYADEKGSINTFSAQYAFVDYQTIETYDCIITPENAMRLLSEELSGYAEYNVIGMELIYCPVLKESVDPNDAGNTHREFAPWSIICSYDIIELSPYWAIYIDVTPTKEIYGLVDCVTGEVGFVNNQR